MSKKSGQHSKQEQPYGDYYSGGGQQEYPGVNHQAHHQYYHHNPAAAAYNNAYYPPAAQTAAGYNYPPPSQYPGAPPRPHLSSPHTTPAQGQYHQQAQYQNQYYPYNYGSLPVPPPVPASATATTQQNHQTKPENRSTPSSASAAASKTKTTSPPVEEKKPTATPIMVGKRRGKGRALPTGIVKKAKTEEPESAKDSWSKYMHEVKKYKSQSCEDDRKNRPLVK